MKSLIKINVAYIVALLLVCMMGMIQCLKSPEQESGEDKTRIKAVELKLEEWTPDSVSYDGGDRTDWKFVTIPNDGLMALQMRFATKDADCIVEIRDEMGNIMFKENSRNFPDVFKLHKDVKKGKYFIGVQAQHEGDASEYTLRVDTKKPADTIPPPE